MKKMFFFAVTLVITCSCVYAQRPDIKVGVYYYPWHGPGVGGHGFTTTLRDHLVATQQPELGYYINYDSDVIEAHICQSVRGNIHFWACSWWGPGGFEDNVLKNYILPHASASKLKYAIMYEAPGRLGSFDSPDYSNLETDFAYLESNYFNHPYYFKIDGHPVVFIYLTRVYFRNQGDQALADLRAAHPNLYIIADDIFGRYYNASNASKWDAVTAYDVYGQSLSPYNSTQTALNYLQSILSDAKTAANSVNVGLIPFACPGFNDRGVRSGHDAAPRYFEDDPQSAEGDLFEAMLRDVVVPQVDPLADNILMVTSFNEWHEDTQIEPTSGIAAATTLDDSATGIEYTQGYSYTDYGYLYIDILHQETCAVVGDLDENCFVDMDDFALFAQHWGNTNCGDCGSADLDGDNNVNLSDLKKLIANWMEGVPLPVFPVAHWELDETAGTTAVDSSDSGYNGTLTNMAGTEWTTDPTRGNVLSLNGGDDYVEMIGYKGISGDASRTCTAWIKTTLNGDILAWGDTSSAGERWQLTIVNNVLYVRVKSGSAYGSTTLTDDQWHHVAVVLDGGAGATTDDIRLYVDGDPETVTVVSQDIVTPDVNNVRIGVAPWSSSYFNGLIDDVRIYDLALTEPEIANMIP